MRCCTRFRSAATCGQSLPSPQVCLIPGPPGPPGEPGYCMNQISVLDIPKSLFNRSGEYKGYATLLAPLTNLDCGGLVRGDFKILSVSIIGNTLPGVLGGLAGGSYEVAVSSGTTFSFVVDKTNRRLMLLFYAVPAAEFLRVIQAVQPTETVGAVWSLSDQVSTVRVFYIS